MFNANGAISQRFIVYIAKRLVVVPMKYSSAEQHYTQLYNRDITMIHTHTSTRTPPLLFNTFVIHPCGRRFTQECYFKYQQDWHSTFVFRGKGRRCSLFDSDLFLLANFWMNILYCSYIIFMLLFLLLPMAT